MFDAIRVAGSVAVIAGATTIWLAVFRAESKLHDGTANADLQLLLFVRLLRGGPQWCGSMGFALLGVAYLFDVGNLRILGASCTALGMVLVCGPGVWMTIFRLRRLKKLVRESENVLCPRCLYELYDCGPMVRCPECGLEATLPSLAACWQRIVGDFADKSATASSEPVTEPKNADESRRR